MKATITIKKEVEIETLKMTVPVRYDDEDMPNDYPHRKGNMWSVLIDVDVGQIHNWPEGVEPLSFYMKVVDGGNYELFEGVSSDKFGEPVLSILQNYVPNNLVPGGWGDYIKFDIDEKGLITNWPSNPNLDDFTQDDED